MGVVSVGDKRDYFFDKKSSPLPFDHVLQGMSRTRWEQIKRYFHIEDPRREGIDHSSGNQTDSRFYHKIQWLVEHIDGICRSLFDPESVLSYDEAMILFMGKSKHTFLASHKPIKEGYEAMVLATPGHSHGYVFTVYLQGTNNSDPGHVVNCSIAHPRKRMAYALNPTNTLIVSHDC